MGVRWSVSLDLRNSFFLEVGMKKYYLGIALGVLVYIVGIFLQPPLGSMIRFIGGFIFGWNFFSIIQNLKNFLKKFFKN